MPIIAQAMPEWCEVIAAVWLPALFILILYPLAALAIEKWLR